MIYKARHWVGHSYENGRFALYIMWNDFFVPGTREFSRRPAADDLVRALVCKSAELTTVQQGRQHFGAAILSLRFQLTHRRVSSLYNTKATTIFSISLSLPYSCRVIIMNALWGPARHQQQAGDVTRRYLVAPSSGAGAVGCCCAFCRRHTHNNRNV